MILNIDGSKIVDMEEFHNQVSSQLEFEKDYGRNLDALWDELNSIDYDLEINVEEAGKLSINLGDYYNKIIGMFMDLSLENGNIDLNLEVK